MLIAICSRRNLIPIDNSQNPVVVMDFVNGIYSFEGAALSVSDVITNTEQIEADGLHVDGTTDYPVAPSIIHESIQDFLDEAQFSAVIHFEVTNAGAYLFELKEWFSGDHVTLWWFNEAELTDANNHDGSRSASDADNGTAAGTHKVAFTRVNEKVAVSIDGNPVGDDGSFEDLFVTMPDPRDTQSDDEGGSTFPMIGFNNYHLGGTYTDGFNSAGDPQGAIIIKSVKLYNQVTDTQLVTLSTL